MFVIEGVPCPAENNNYKHADEAARVRFAVRVRLSRAPANVFAARCSLQRRSLLLYHAHARGWLRRAEPQFPSAYWCVGPHSLRAALTPTAPGNALTDVHRPTAGGADEGWQAAPRRNRSVSAEAIGSGLVSIQHTEFSPPPNGYSSHDGLQLPTVTGSGSRPFRGRSASAAGGAFGDVTKLPDSADINYYHGRRRTPSRSFDSTPWHQLHRNAWDASPPGAWRGSQLHPTPLHPLAQHSTRTVEPPHHPPARRAHPPSCAWHSATPCAVPSGVVAAPEAERHRHRPEFQRSGTTRTGNSTISTSCPVAHSHSPHTHPHPHLEHHCHLLSTRAPISSQSTPAAPHLYLLLPPMPERAAVKDTARVNGCANGPGRRAAKDSLCPPRQHEVSGRAGSYQARTHRGYRSGYDGAPID